MAWRHNYAFGNSVMILFGSAWEPQAWMWSRWVAIRIKTKATSQKLREQIILLHLMVISQDTTGSIIGKFKTYGTAANLRDHERNSKISSRPLSNLIRTTEKTLILPQNSCRTWRRLGQVFQWQQYDKHWINKEFMSGLHDALLLLTTRNIKGWLEYPRRNLDSPTSFWEWEVWTDEIKWNCFRGWTRRFSGMRRASMEVGHWLFSAAGIGGLDCAPGVKDSQKYWAI